MTIKITKLNLNYQDQITNALLFENVDKPISHNLAIFCHGYTSHKGALLTWASRLCEEGLAVVLFDLPGHYLGNFSEVKDFNYFKQNAHRLFEDATKQALKHLNNTELSQTNIVLGGHSLGALMCLKASMLDFFKTSKGLELICVGFGSPPKTSHHIFNSAFYKSTLNLRSELVSSELNPENVFSWIKDEKINLPTKNKKIYMLTGEDDLVVGREGFREMNEILVALGNEVIVEEPKKLAHHQPELAAAHIKKYLKDQGYFN